MISVTLIELVTILLGMFACGFSTNTAIRVFVDDRPSESAAVIMAILWVLFFAFLTYSKLFAPVPLSPGLAVWGNA